jgi:hypothetical protein
LCHYRLTRQQASRSSSHQACWLPESCAKSSAVPRAPNQGSWCRDRMCHQKQVVTREFQEMNTGRFVSICALPCALQRRSKMDIGTFLEDWHESWIWTWTWRRRSVILSDYPSGLVSGALIPSPAKYYIQQHQDQDSRQSDCSQHAIATRLHSWERGPCQDLERRQRSN